MCVLALAWRTHPRWPLALAGNRDELHARPSLPAHRWQDAPHVLAGRDLEAGGAWLGVSEQGRLATVTNVRDPAGPRRDRASRGELTRAFLAGERPLEDLPSVDMAAYNACNLIAVQGDEAAFLTNRPAPGHRPLGPGLYGMSNGALDEPWPKTLRLKAALARWLDEGGPGPEPLLAALADETPAPDAHLPDTGVGLERERLLSACFLRGPAYGTRASTVILVDADGRGLLVERSFGPDGVPLGEVSLDFAWPA